MVCINKYFAMNTSFRISLLYLLLIIPQHGNSPLPVMESWLQKDQDDGFVQRDMTSSLTGGDESFGSAHQTYQNSLIRQKKADNLENEMPSANFRTYAAKYDPSQHYKQPNLFYQDRYMNKDFRQPVVENDASNPLFRRQENFGMPYNKFMSNLRGPNGEAPNPRYMNMFGSDRNLRNNNMKLMNNRLGVHPDSDRSLNPLNDDFGRSAKWSMCKKLSARYAPNPFVGLAQQSENREALNFDDNPSLQNDYFSLEDEQRGREIRNQEFKGRPDGKNPQIFDENEYYEAEANPANGEEDDYDQMIDSHGYVHKRDETKQLEAYPKISNSEASKVVLDALTAPDFAKSYTSDSMSPLAIQEDMTHFRKSNSKTRDVDIRNRMPESDLVWKLTSDFQAKELNNVMRDSQKALKEVQQFQQKLTYKSGEANDNDGLKQQNRDELMMKSEKRNTNFEEGRLKREDEDEQKNMKTGTDEGGGGEYEDEEGKGHKDEEEYYEDADLSNDESGTEIQTTDELNQKYVKRETTDDSQVKNKKEETENNSPEFELNLENAPVENSGKSKKTSYREGEKTKKNSVRKGVKIWDEWGKWSPCSVTCGVGRSTRWRHCIGGGCAQGEKEAQIKRCTNPAC